MNPFKCIVNALAPRRVPPIATCTDVAVREEPVEVPNNMQEREHSSYMTDKEYLDALLRLQDLILSGLPLTYENSDFPGDKSTECSWGLCSEEIAMWPEPGMHMWLERFERDKYVSTKYRCDHHQCPMDVRSKPSGNGCFWTCLVFQYNERRRVFGTAAVSARDSDTVFRAEVMRRLDQRISEARRILSAVDYAKLEANTMPMNMDDRELSAYALDMWANNIETGNPSLSAQDSAAQKLPVKALGVDQMHLIIRLRDLAVSLRKASADMKMSAHLQTLGRV